MKDEFRRFGPAQDPCVERPSAVRENIDERKPALVSVHDVMPQTLRAVQRCLDECRRQEVETVYLLVVPGPAWDWAQLQQLHRWSAEGHLIAGHGWRHRTQRVTRLYHRLHSALVSRNVAEHLECDEAEILMLMQKCFQWFTRNDLPSPSLYVPPAWALGQVRLSQVHQTGFRHVETLRGIYHVPQQRWKEVPLLGYEADTGSRATALRLWNGVNRGMASIAGLKRIAIHPYDLDYRLSGALRADLCLCRAVTVYDIFA